MRGQVFKMWMDKKMLNIFSFFFFFIFLPSHQKKHIHNSLIIIGGWLTFEHSLLFFFLSHSLPLFLWHNLPYLCNYLSRAVKFWLNDSFLYTLSSSFSCLVGLIWFKFDWKEKKNNNNWMKKSIIRIRSTS